MGWNIWGDKPKKKKRLSSTVVGVKDGRNVYSDGRRGEYDSSRLKGTGGTVDAYSPYPVYDRNASGDYANYIGREMSWRKDLVNLPNGKMIRNDWDSLSDGQRQGLIDNPSTLKMFATGSDDERRQVGFDIGQQAKRDYLSGSSTWTPPNVWGR